MLQIFNTSEIWLRRTTFCIQFTPTIVKQYFQSSENFDTLKEFFVPVSQIYSKIVTRLPWRSFWMLGTTFWTHYSQRVVPKVGRKRSYSLVLKSICGHRLHLFSFRFFAPLNLLDFTHNTCSYSIVLQYGQRILSTVTCFSLVCSMAEPLCIVFLTPTIA